MMSGGIYFVSTRCGDIIGTYLYDRFDSFDLCVLMMVCTYSFIPLLLLIVPQNIFVAMDEL